MRYFKFAKLVRDKIIGHMKADNQIPYGVKILDDAEYIKKLSKKLVEEANELINITDTKELKKELSDVQEVIDCLRSALHMSHEDMKKYQEKKIQKNGSFKKRMYIEYIGIKEDDAWVDYYKKIPNKHPEIQNTDEDEVQ